MSLIEILQNTDISSLPKAEQEVFADNIANISDTDSQVEGVKALNWLKYAAEKYKHAALRKILSDYEKELCSENNDGFNTIISEASQQSKSGAPSSSKEDTRIQLKLKKVTSIKISSSSAIECIDGKLYIVGDDATHIMVADTDLKNKNHIRLFKGYDERIPKIEKSDLEASAIINKGTATEPERYLLIAGSGSLPNREIFIEAPLNDISKFKTIPATTFYNRLKVLGINNLNIEGMSSIAAISVVMASRGNRTNPAGYLIATSPDFYEGQEEAPIVIMEIELPEKNMSISGLCYMANRDILLFTASTENSPDAIADGPIGDSYIGWFNNMSQRLKPNSIKPDVLFNLSENDDRFKKQKIEGICVEDKIDKSITNYVIHMVSDNDNGNSVLFTASLNIPVASSPPADAGKFYYNSHGIPMVWPDFVDLEVERGNNTRKKLKALQDKYKIGNSHKVIWVTENPMIALSYEAEAESRNYCDKLTLEQFEEKYEVDASSLAKFTEEDGYLIPETNDGDEGFLMVLKTKKKAGGQVELTPEEEMQLHARWNKKKDRIMQLSTILQKLRYNLTSDMKSDDEKTRLTALVIAIMDKTAERVGNEESGESGHHGVTGFKKKHIKITGNTIDLKYTGKSGVEHEKSFSDELIAKTLKKAIKDSPDDYVFVTGDGFKIQADRINRYLQEYKITAKDIRGYTANKFIVSRLEKEDIEPEEKGRIKQFRKAAKFAAQKVGHGVATLKKHYMIPELEEKFVHGGEILNLGDFFKNGGPVKKEEDADNIVVYPIQAEPKPLVVNDSQSALSFPAQKESPFAVIEKNETDFSGNQSKFLGEIGVYYNKHSNQERVVVHTSRDMADFLYKIWDKHIIELQESFYVIYLNRFNRVIAWHSPFRGGVTGTVADVRIIVATAAKVLASSVIVAHNHPSGNLQPSAADTSLTRNLREALKPLEIVLMDSLILVPNGNYYSFGDAGILEKGGHVSSSVILPDSNLDQLIFGDSGEIKKEADAIQAELWNVGLGYYGDSIQMNQADLQTVSKIKSAYSGVISKIKESLGNSDTITLFRSQEVFPNGRGNYLSFTSDKNFAHNWKKGDIDKPILTFVLEVDVPFGNIISIKTSLGQREFIVENKGVVRESLIHEISVKQKELNAIGIDKDSDNRHIYSALMTGRIKKAVESGEIPKAYALEVCAAAGLDEDIIHDKVLAALKELHSVPAFDMGGLFHGSSYNFDKFSSEKMGTGEGATAFGWGLYFTSIPEIAEHYANSAYNHAIEYKDSFDHDGFNYYVERGYAGLIAFKEDLSIENLGDRFSKRKVISYDEYWAALKKEKNLSKQIYKITLRENKPAQEFRWLDWDKMPSADNVQRIKEQLKIEDKFPVYDLGKGEEGRFKGEYLLKIFNAPQTVHYEGGLKGQNLYAELSAFLGSDESASLLLLRAGIDGIRYPTDSLAKNIKNLPRGFNSGMNYVVFDPSIISIDEKVELDRELKDADDFKKPIATVATVKPDNSSNEDSRSFGKDWKLEEDEDDSSMMTQLFFANLHEADVFKLGNKTIVVIKVVPEQYMKLLIGGIAKKVDFKYGHFVGSWGKGHDWFDQIFRDVEGLLTVDLINRNNKFHTFSEFWNIAHRDSVYKGKQYESGGLLETKEDVLKQCVVSGNVVKLPPLQLDRKLYMDTAKALELISGKWNRKEQGFVFASDPTELLEQIATGEKRNLKKEFQFFATPADLADWLVQLAEIKPNETILEPSAGQGAIVQAIHRKLPDALVYCYELMPVNISILSKLPGIKIIGEDFLSPLPAYAAMEFDTIIANPPFSKNQDIDHVRKMYACLKPGGRLVSVMSKHWQQSDNKKETEFREWLKTVYATVEEIPAGKFKESGTAIATVVVVIDKPKSKEKKKLPEEYIRNRDRELNSIILDDTDSYIKQRDIASNLRKENSPSISETPIVNPPLDTIMYYGKVDNADQKWLEKEGRKSYSGGSLNPIMINGKMVGGIHWDLGGIDYLVLKPEYRSKGYLRKIVFDNQDENGLVKFVTASPELTEKLSSYGNVSYDANSDITTVDVLKRDASNLIEEKLRNLLQLIDPNISLPSIKVENIITPPLVQVKKYNVKDEIKELKRELGLRLSESLRSEIIGAIKALQDNDTTYLAELSKFGESLRHQIMNRAAFKSAKQLGFDTFQMDEYGWYKAPAWSYIEKIEFAGKGHRSASGNSITIAQGINGKWTYGVQSNTGGAGGGYVPSSSPDPKMVFNTREDAIKAATDELKVELNKHITSTDTVSYKPPYIKAVLKEIDSYVNAGKGQQVLFK